MSSALLVLSKKPKSQQQSTGFVRTGAYDGLPSLTNRIVPNCAATEEKRKTVNTKLCKPETAGPELGSTVHIVDTAQESGQDKPGRLMQKRHARGIVTVWGKHLQAQLHTHTIGLWTQHERETCGLTS